MEEENKNFGQVLHQWEFYEIDPTRHDTVNRAIIAVLLVAMVIFSLWSRNFLFTVFLFLMVLMVVFFKKNNRKIRFAITNRGVVIQNALHEYDTIENFYIIYKPPAVKKIFFETKGILTPRISIFLKDVNPVEVRNTLKKYLSEDLNKETEPLSEQLSRLLRF